MTLETERGMTSSDDVIEIHVAAHCTLIAAAGEVPTERHLQTYREALQALVKLARSEYALGVAQDLERVRVVTQG